MDSLLLLSFLFLTAGIIMVPIASRLGLGSVLGYLIAGILLGPLLAWLGVDVVAIQHIAEFGVVMMLFLVGLELEPKMLWHMRTRLLGLGGLQVAVTAALIMGVVMLLGQPWTVSLAIGLILTLSSTAIVLQTLGEKGLMKSDGGQASFAVLLFQDIAVIPMLALLPLLALPELADLAHDGGHGAAHGDAHGDGQSDENGDAHGDEHGWSINLVDALPGWLRAVVTLAAIGVVVVGGSYLTRPIFRFVDTAKLRELFTATALAMVIGIAVLMTAVGLSPALGAFLAGVVLANSEYRHELESDIAPFKGLLLGVFFITVGAAIDFGLLGRNLLTVLALTIGMVAIKAGVLFVLAMIFRVEGSDRWLFSLGLAQAGEFGFVLISFTLANNVLPREIADMLLLVVALSMMLTPGLFIFYDRFIAPRYAKAQTAEPDEIDEGGTIIIAGHGRFGGIVNRMLLGQGFQTVVLDHDSRQLEMLRTFGIKVFFGDATRPDMLHAAGIDSARMLVVAIDGREQATELVRHVSTNHPDVYIVSRAIDRHHVYELYAAGCRDIIRDTFDSAVRAGRSAMEGMGVHPYDAQRRSKEFASADRKALAALAPVYDPSLPGHQNKEYVRRVKEIAAQQEAELRGEKKAYSARVERAWSPPTLDDVQAETEAAQGGEFSKP